MGFLDKRTISVLITVLVVLGVLALVWAARRPLISLILAIFFAHLLDPVVSRFEGWLHLTRRKAIALTYVGILVGLAIFGWTVGPRIIHQGQRLPDLLEKVRSGSIAFQVGGYQGWSRSTEFKIQAWLISHQADIERYAHDVMNYAAQASSNLAWILLVPVLAIFFLSGGSRIGSSLLELIQGEGNRDFVGRVLSDLDNMLARYIRAQLLLSFFAIIAYGAFLLIVQLPYAFAVATIAGVLEFIPIVGPILALCIIVGIAFLTGYSHWIALVAFWLVWRGIQDYVNAPRVMNKGLDLHPLLAIFAVLVGGELGGVLGIFLSIPAVTTLRILWINWVRSDLARKAA